MATANPDPHDPYGAYLNMIAAQGARIAARLEERVMSAETAEEEARAALVWVKVGRALRQTLLLDAKLIRERQAFRRDFGPQMERDHAKRVARRRTQVHEAVQAEIYSEYEKPEDHEIGGHLIGDLFDVLDDEAEKPGFLDEPVQLQIDRIRHMLGLGEFADADEAEGAASEADDPTAGDPPAADPHPIVSSGAMPRVFTVEPKRAWPVRDPGPADSS